MLPSDLIIIFNRLNYLNTKYDFDTLQDPFIYQEVIDSGHEAVSKKEYTYASVTEFLYSSEITRCFTGGDELKWLEGFGEQWGLLPSYLAVVCVYLTLISIFFFIN